ncbi:hypothetical protein MAJ_06129, partial [Metarhizium majus ARSEF 297]
MARQSLLAGVAAVAVALVKAADSTTTTVSMLQPLADGARLKLRGSVVGVDGDKTTYGFGCEAGASTDSCLPEGTSMTVVQGPSTFVQSIQATMSDWDGKVGGDEAEDAEDLLHQSAVIQFFNRSLEFSCKLNPDQNRAECGGMAGVSVGSATFMSQGTDVLTSYKEMLVPVVITAGVDKLSPAPGATQTGNVPAATGSAGASRTTSLATISGSKAPSSTASASTAGATTTNAAGAVVPRHLGLAGVAAGIGAALLLL